MPQLPKKEDKGKVMSVHPPACRINKMIQCDEARPICRPCLKGKLACGYELLAGQTRAQASTETQQRLRGELHAYAALIHALRCSDSNASVTILDRLRHGDYDEALLRNDSAFEMAPLADRVYPWECPLFEDERHLELRTDMLPPIGAIMPVRNNGRLRFPPQSMPTTSARSQSEHVKTGVQPACPERCISDSR